MPGNQISPLLACCLGERRKVERSTLLNLLKAIVLSTPLSTPCFEELDGLPRAGSVGPLNRGVLVLMGTSPYGRSLDNASFLLWTALGQTEDVQMLLQLGADPTLLDRQSRSAVDVLKRNKNFKAIEKINSHLEKLATSSKDLSGTVLVD